MLSRRAFLGGVTAAAAGGCGFGPKAIDTGRLRFNESVKTTSDQQLLLNIVRLRYTDSPSSLAVTSIADQRELIAGLKAIPFFTAAGAGDVGSYRGAVLPQLELSGVTRPTLSYTPQDDAEFTRRLFTPITLEGTAYLVKTTWPIATVFRLYLENLNWVSNAETGSGPTPRLVPEYAEFLAGVRALQRLQDRKLIAIYAEEKAETLTDAVPAGSGTAAAAVEAVKAGYEYRAAKDGGWTVVKKKSQPLLRIGAVPANDPDFAAFCTAFKLDPAKRTFPLTTDALDPFPEKGEPLAALDLETRSLLQVLFFLSHGVDVPACDLASGAAPSTDGGFDWDVVLGDLFKVHSACGKHPPGCAQVSVQYRGTWFYIDARDRDTKATFALVMEVSRLELGAKSGAAPILTLPLGN